MDYDENTNAMFMASAAIGRTYFGHGTAARWDVCDCEDCHRARPYPRNCTLSPEEVADAAEDGVDTADIEADVSHARRGGRWFWTQSKTAFTAGLYDEAHDVWPVLGNTAAGLDRVVDHWARVAELDKIAAATAASLKDARSWADEHANKMAAMLDNVSATDMQRLRLIEARNLLVDFDRLIRFYEAQADGSKPTEQRDEAMRQLADLRVEMAATFRR